MSKFEVGDTVRVVVDDAQHEDFVTTPIRGTVGVVVEDEFADEDEVAVHFEDWSDDSYFYTENELEAV